MTNETQMALRVLLLLPLQAAPHLQHHDLSQRTTVDQLPGVLQLGINCSSHDRALDIADLLEEWYQEQQDFLGNEGATHVNKFEFFTASTQRRLFVTAAMRQHVTALRTMTTMPQIMQHVDVATLHKVLKQLAAAGFISTIRALLESESMQETELQLTSKAALELLLAAVEQGSCASAELLCSLPAATQLSAEAVVQLLQAAVGQNNNSCAELLVVLCKLPGANQLTADELAQVLKAAVVQHNGGCTEILCKLPAAQQLAAEALVQLLQAAAACCKHSMQQAVIEAF
jgi:dsDNA-binding SOS-regulon protein